MMINRNCTPEDLNLIYESVSNQVEEGVVISDDENQVMFINHAAEAIEGVDAKKSLHKCMEALKIFLAMILPLWK